MAVQFKWDLLHEMAMAQVFLPVFQFSIVSIIPPKLHNHLYLNPYPANVENMVSSSKWRMGFNSAFNL
jgi:hypothetical protein